MQTTHFLSILWPLPNLSIQINLNILQYTKEYSIKKDS